jgi:hypothetical protein
VLPPETRLPLPAHTRPGLVLQRTLLRDGGGKNRRHFDGLFTLEDIPAGSFLGFYTGRFYDEEEGDAPRTHYNVSVANSVIVPTRNRDGSVDLQRYPMAAMNEPPRDEESNVVLVEWDRARDAIPGLEPPSRRVTVAAMHTCRPVRAGEELYLHYGGDPNDDDDGYDRRHYGRKPRNVGRPGRTLPLRNMEKPRHALEARGIAALPADDTIYL